MRKLTVNEIIKSKGIMLHKGKINLIIAPAGSGKTYYIFNTLLDVTKKSVYLCDTSNLQEMILKDKEIIGKVKSTGFDMIEGFYIDGFNCTVMTYAKWFYEMNKEEYKDVETIICDEIHNLYKYKDKFDKEEDKENGIKECKNYENVISNLHQNAKNGVQVVGFTATHERIKREMNFFLPKDDSNITNATNEKWNVINLSNEKNIRRLTSDFTFFFNNYRNLGHYLKVFNGFKYGKKALIYTNRVTECEDMINICNSIGLKSIALWSINNTKNPMNEEQLEVRESILTTGIIPRDYQILIINETYETEN